MSLKNQLLSGGGIGRAQAVGAVLRTAGGKATANNGSVGSVQAAATIRCMALAAYSQIGVLLNNAGIVVIGDTDTISEDIIEYVVETNLFEFARVSTQFQGSI